MDNFTIEDAKEVIKAWDALPGGQHYDKSTVTVWLAVDMAPMIKKLRMKVDIAESRARVLKENIQREYKAIENFKGDWSKGIQEKYGISYQEIVDIINL